MASFWNRSDGTAKAAPPQVESAPTVAPVPNGQGNGAAHPNGVPPPPPPQDELADVLAKVRRTLYQTLRANIPPDAADQPQDTLRKSLSGILEGLLREQGTLLDPRDQVTVVRMVLDDVYGFGPLSELMRDTDISDILVNGPFQVFVEKRGQLRASDATFDDVPHLLRIVHRMVDKAGRRLDAASPMVDARLPDGSRMNAILNPPAINGPLLSIRRFGSRPLTAEDLIGKESLTQEMLDFLAACVRCRLNIVVSGGTGTGKTTLLNALSRFIRPTERIATIEDTAELELQQPHIVKMESRVAEADGTGEITIRELVKNTLRVRPDRIIIGECRGAEALEMLQAMNTGHEGSMTTIHANSPREALSRMELMISLGGVELPLWALRRQMATSINLVIQVARQLGGTRKVVRISEVTGMEGDMISMHDIFQYVQTGVEDDVAVGQFASTGIRPTCLERLQAAGAELPPQMFAPPRRPAPTRP